MDVMEQIYEAWRLGYGLEHSKSRVYFCGEMFLREWGFGSSSRSQVVTLTDGGIQIFSSLAGVTSGKIIMLVVFHHYPNPNRLPHSCVIAIKPHNAFPSAAISLSPTPAIPSRPAANSIPFPTTHLERAPTDASIAAGK